MRASTLICSTLILFLFLPHVQAQTANQFPNDPQIKQIDSRIAAIEAQLTPMRPKRAALIKAIQAETIAKTDSSSDTAALKDLSYRMIPLVKEETDLRNKRAARVASLQLQAVK